MDYHYLLIPPTGLLEVFESGDPLTPEQVQSALAARGGEGAYMTMTYAVDEVADHGQVEWYVNQIGPINERARRALADLTGIHTIFTGPVMFSGLGLMNTSRIVQHLSAKET